MTEQYHDLPYIDLIYKILANGVQKGDRTGTGTLSLFAQQMRFDLSDGSLPMLTTKKMFTRGIIHEILWYLTGDTNIKYLVDNDVHIWDEWADENGDLGPVYGAQWRAWPKNTIEFVDDDGYYVPGDDGSRLIRGAAVREEKIDQIAMIIDQLKNNPNDRRIIVNAWNVADVPDMALPPCHLLFQFWCHDGKLKCHLYQRSCDVGLGVPFNIVQYSILTHMIAHVTGLEAVEFIWTGGDCHIYNNHIEQLREQATREPYESPRLVLNPDVEDIDSFDYSDFKIEGYDEFWPTLKMDVSV